MTDPVIISCLNNTWQLAVSNATSALIHVKNTKPDNYLHTYRMTGESAPLPSEIEDALPIRDRIAKLETVEPVDVYIMSRGEDGEYGEIRVDNA